LDSTCAGLPGAGCEMIPTPSLLALPSSPMAIMVAFSETRNVMLFYVERRSKSKTPLVFLTGLLLIDKQVGRLRMPTHLAPHTVI
jgi:hypothetical protein